MARNVIKIQDVYIDVNSIESITSDVTHLYYGNSYKVEIIMKSGKNHLFVFTSEEERDKHFNKLLKEWIDNNEKEN